MQRGHVYIHGTGCPVTHNGQHLVELPDEDEADRQKPGWCRMCALEFPRLEIENDLLREALTWTVGYLRGHVNVETYPDFYNAAKLVDGEQAVNYGHFQTVQNLWEHVGWQEKEIAILKGRVSYMERVKDGYRGELKRWEAAAEWVKDDWPQIDTGHNSVCVYRLEDGQGEHRLFEAPTLLEAVEKAMNAPPFTGEKMEDMRSRQRLRIAELEEFVRLVRDSYDGEHSEGKCLSAICLQCGAGKLLPKGDGSNA